MNSSTDLIRLGSATNNAAVRLLPTAHWHDKRPTS